MSHHSEHGKATFIPVTRNYFRKLNENDEKTPESLMESIYWQSLGWVHTPPFLAVDFSRQQTETLSSKTKSSHSNLYFKKAFDPKVQVESKVPYGYLPRSVVTDIQKRKFASQSLSKILRDMGLDVDMVRPPILYHRESLSILKADTVEGIPSQPFLKLEQFDDDWFYESRPAKEWLSLGTASDERRPVPGTSLIPVDSRSDPQLVKFEWLKVAVLDYDEEKKLYLVRNEKDCPLSGKAVFDSEAKSDLWVPRIYLKFEAEDPIKFAERLRTAVSTRHLAEENLRLNYYVENMPVEQGTPSWSEDDVKDIIKVVRRSLQLRNKLQWIKDHLHKNIKELQTEYARAVNYMTYVHMTGQNPNLMTGFENQKLFPMQLSDERFAMTNLNYTFRERFERFSCITLLNQAAAIRVMLLVQDELLCVKDMDFYKLPKNEVVSLEKFETMQREGLQKINQYVCEPWLVAIANAVTSNFKNFTDGDYDLNQIVVHTFQLTKIGKLLRQIGFKMQDVLRYVVTGSLRQYVRTFQDACENLHDAKDGYVWTDSFTSEQWKPLNDPVFEVSLEIKDVQLKFTTDLKKYREAVINFFDEGLSVTQNLPKLEKLVMKKLLYNPDQKIESVGSWEKEIIQWKKSIVTGLSKAIIVATAYTRFYDNTLKQFQEDQINYVKRLMRSKTTCAQLKDIIEMHHSEKSRLEHSIPDYMDIGPFRLMTATVRMTAMKKHEQLADAVLTYFYDKFRQNMETINDQFLVLLDRIEQGTGNIEDLLERKVWCRRVPKRVQKLSVEINVMRSDCRLLYTFNRNMEDDDFTTFWRVQELPQLTMRRLNERVLSFEEERETHRKNLLNDLQQLGTSLAHLEQELSNLRQCWDLEQAHSMADDVRGVRKELITAKEKAQLFKKRERLFGLPSTEYPQIEEMSKNLAPYELFWCNAAEFFKYQERVVSKDLVMDKSELREKIIEFRVNVESSVEHFTEDVSSEIRSGILSVLDKMDAFLNSRWLQ